MPPKGRAVTAILQPVTAALRALELQAGSVIVTAVSGGPDSVALLHALAALRARFDFRLVAAHLNHRLRGAEADRDENFVRELGARLAVELHVEQARGLQPGGANLEERARKLRHAFLNRVADRVKASHIALAHHAGDQAETVLMRLLRGSGAHGLAAMATCGPGRLWRPLLAVDRAAVIAYLTALGAAWVTDQSNASTRILRNRLRHELLPILERDFAPGLGPRLVELADEMRAVDEYLTAAARTELARRCDGARLGLAGFDRLNPALAQAMLREFIRAHRGDLRSLARDHVVAMYRLCVADSPGGRVPLPGRWQLRREYDRAVLEPVSAVVAPSPFLVVLDPAGTTLVAAAGFIFEARLLERSSGKPDSGRGNEPWRLPVAPMEALFDANQLGGPLAVRNFAAGDRIAPDGMHGTRKVQDLFVDRKLGRARRGRWPLVMANGRILWIPGIARSRVALVTAATRQVQLVRATEDPARTRSDVA